jgi:hypothetical protein
MFIIIVFVKQFINFLINLSILYLLTFKFLVQISLKIHASKKILFLNVLNIPIINIKIVIIMELLI